MTLHAPFDDTYWNLAQAAAWVEYREKQLVEDFDIADRDAYVAIGMYPKMWPEGRKRYDRIEDLRRALEKGELKSSGFRRGGQARLEDIPAAEWADYVIRPPVVSFAGQLESIPWENVRVLSADMKRLWRNADEVSLRTKFDWPAIRKIYEEVVDQQPRMTKNKVIEEVQVAYAECFNKEPPSRSSLQRKIKTWY